MYRFGEDLTLNTRKDSVTKVKTEGSFVTCKPNKPKRKTLKGKLEGKKKWEIHSRKVGIKVKGEFWLTTEINSISLCKPSLNSDRLMRCQRIN